jgi:hypothetical protein
MNPSELRSTDEIKYGSLDAIIEMMSRENISSGSLHTDVFEKFISTLACRHLDAHLLFARELSDVYRFSYIFDIFSIANICDKFHISI